MISCRVHFGPTGDDLDRSSGEQSGDNDHGEHVTHGNPSFFTLAIVPITPKFCDGRHKVPLFFVDFHPGGPIRDGYLGIDGALLSNTLSVCRIEIFALWSCVMRNQTPLAPGEPDVTVHLVLNDFGRLGRAYSETDEANADEKTIVENILSGQYSSLLRVVAFNIAEGWARDVTEDIAWAVLTLARRQHRSIGKSAQEFLERALGVDAPVAETEQFGCAFIIEDLSLTPAQEIREARDWLAHNKHDPFLWIAILMTLAFVTLTFGGNVIFPPSDAKRAIAKVLPSDADIRFIKNRTFFCESSRGKYIFGYDFGVQTDQGLEAVGSICRDVVNGQWILAFDNPKFKYLESR